MSKESSPRLVAGWLLFAFGVWFFTFRGFLTSKFCLTSDALSYCDHTRFFVENLAHGVYPMWDPFWCHGAPNDFFLRRIGALNPLYVAILILKSVGIPFTLSYLWCLAGYYWGGMMAFYLLAMRIYHDRYMAYAGYLMLLFSALGTRLFDSYMMLVTVPLIWFFYFLVAFTQTPRKHFFAGMVLALMILMSTYIPFYFLIILGLFFVLFAIIYANKLTGIFDRYRSFFKENKILVSASALILTFAFFSTVIFFHDFSRGQVVLPYRHGGAGLGQILTVPPKTLDWGAVEDLLYSAYFSNLKLYKFAVVYVPFFSVIVLVLGCIGRINRRAVFIFLLGTVLLCGIVPHGLPFYNFFYQHVFFLKYFRNLHFFIWFFLMPLFVVLVLEQWHMFNEFISINFRRQWVLLAYVLAVHVMAFIFVWWRKDAILSTYVMMALSLVFWSLMSLGRLKPNFGGFLLLTLTVLIQPLETYHYLCLKAIPHPSLSYYDSSYRPFTINDAGLIKPENIPTFKDTLYYASNDYNFIYQNVSNYALAKYLQYKFILVDHLHIVDRDTMPSVLERNFLSNDNMAFVDKDTAGETAKLDGNDPDPSPVARRIDADSQGFKLLSFDANRVRVGLDVPYEKFLVYNDSYNPLWRVSINHHLARLYEVNGAFKGTWIPAGKSVVEFSYGHWWQYMMDVLLSIFALIFLAGIIWQVCL